MRTQSPKAQPQTWKPGKQTLLVSEGPPGHTLCRQGTEWGSQGRQSPVPRACGTAVCHRAGDTGSNGRNAHVHQGQGTPGLTGRGLGECAGDPAACTFVTWGMAAGPVWLRTGGVPIGSGSRSC